MLDNPEARASSRQFAPDRAVTRAQRLPRIFHERRELARDSSNDPDSSLIYVCLVSRGPARRALDRRGCGDDATRESHSEELDSRELLLETSPRGRRLA